MDEIILQDKHTNTWERPITVIGEGMYPLDKNYRQRQMVIHGHDIVSLAL